MDRVQGKPYDFFFEVEKGTLSKPTPITSILPTKLACVILAVGRQISCQLGLSGGLCGGYSISDGA